MTKGEFLALCQKHFSDRVPEVKLTDPQVSALVASVFEAILMVVERGDELRLPPFGVYFPRILHRDGELVMAKIGFQSFSKVDDRLLQRFARLPMFKISENANIRMTSPARSVEVKDQDGNRLYSISKVANLAGISSPTANKYLARHKDKVAPLKVETPSGVRYRWGVVELFRSIKMSNLERMRPKVLESQVPEPPPRDTLTDKDLLSLADVSRQSRISILTLYKYLMRYPEQLGPFVRVNDSGRRLFEPGFVNQVISIKQRNMTRFLSSNMDKMKIQLPGPPSDPLASQDSNLRSIEVF